MRPLPPGTLLARLDALADPCAIPVRLDASDTFCSVIVTRRGEAIAAFRNLCPHAGIRCSAPMAASSCRTGASWCARGMGRASALETGACAGGPCNGDGLTPVAIVVRDGAVLVA